ncbi:MAG: hypothetical protein ACI86M_003557, partial [Saprospiraceae bacterium]
MIINFRDFSLRFFFALLIFSVVLPSCKDDDTEEE